MPNNELVINKNFDTTTCIKAGLSTVGDLYNLVTKNVTKYPVLAT